MRGLSLILLVCVCAAAAFLPPAASFVQPAATSAAPAVVEAKVTAIVASPIDGPTTAEPGDLVVLSAGIDAKGYAWTSIPDSKKWMAVDGNRKVVFASGKPGVYTFVLATASGDYPCIYQHVVTIGGSAPNPPQPPTPDPTPAPGAKRQVMFLYRSSDLDNLSPAQQTLLASLKLRKSLAEAGHQFVGCFDAEVVPAALAPWATAAAGKPLPLLLTAPIAGGDIRVVPLPASTTELAEILGLAKGASR